MAMTLPSDQGSTPNNPQLIALVICNEVKRQGRAYDLLGVGDGYSAKRLPEKLRRWFYLRVNGVDSTTSIRLDVTNMATGVMLDFYTVTTSEQWN
jgi:hypothetical protein